MSRSKGTSTMIPVLAVVVSIMSLSVITGRHAAWQDFFFGQEQPTGWSQPAEPNPAGGTVPEYSRAEFGQRWADVDHNGCDTRNDILNRDLTDVTHKAGTHGCVVLTGVLEDLYTGQTIWFTRGQGTSEEVQIDHVVPLAYAWKHGASTWTAQQRLMFANDPGNLLAVSGHENQSKGDKGPNAWMPPNQAAWCVYATKFTTVATMYGVDVPEADMAVLDSVLAGCE